MNNIKRGDIYYIEDAGKAIGSEQRGDRPAIIVSNNMNNENSPAVEVVYMTTQPKHDLPTHVVIHSTRVPSTVLCEQVHTVSVERLRFYKGTCTEEEMDEINKALLISLELGEYLSEEDETPSQFSVKQEKETESVSPTLIRLETERNLFKGLYEQLLHQFCERTVTKEVS